MVLDVSVVFPGVAMSHSKPLVADVIRCDRFFSHQAGLWGWPVLSENWRERRPPFQSSVIARHTRECPRCGLMGCLRNVVRQTFSRLSKAFVFDRRSLAFASCMTTVRLSSMTVEPIVVILRLIRSGDWTIRERVRAMESATLETSLLRFSCRVFERC